MFMGSLSCTIMSTHNTSPSHPGFSEDPNGEISSSPPSLLCWPPQSEARPSSLSYMRPSHHPASLSVLRNSHAPLEAMTCCAGYTVYWGSQPFFQVIKQMAGDFNILEVVEYLLKKMFLKPKSYLYLLLKIGTT